MGRFEPLPTDPHDSPREFGATCSACRHPTQAGTKFCTNCDVLRSDAELGHTRRYAASRWARLLARLLDSLVVAAFGVVVFIVLEGSAGLDVDGTGEIDLAALNVSTLIGTGCWFVWFAIVAPRGQTPGKLLARIRIITADGRDASTGLNWRREGLFQFVSVVPTLFAEPLLSPPEAVTSLLVLAPFVVLADVLFIFFGPDRQTLHDRIFGTLVIRHRPVEQPSAELRAL